MEVLLYLLRKGQASLICFCYLMKNFTWWPSSLQALKGEDRDRMLSFLHIFLCFEYVK